MTGQPVISMVTSATQSGLAQNEDLVMRRTATCAREGCDNEPVVRFCSEGCKIKHHNDQRDRSNPTTKDCAVCGRTFTDVPNRITCSDKCRQKLYQSRKIVRAAEANAIC